MTNIDRLGYYQVGWKKFHHKTLALIEHTKTRQPLEWIFNDSIYGAIDWSVPIPESLDELYRKRAQQLRDTYDYLALYFSGGADAANMLRVFLNNNIFIDEIVMQIPESARPSCNGTDTSSVNHYSEIPYSAVPILNELKNLIHPNTKVRYQDTSKAILELLSHDDWYESNPFGLNIAINPLARQYAAMTDPHVLKLADAGKKVAQIVGVDKPLLINDGKDYYYYFLDVMALHVPPVDLNQLEISNKHYITEFFYWTPDLPEIVVKQAQEVKKHCELDPNVRKLVCDTSIHVQYLRPILHPIIYPSSPEVPFQVKKDGMGAFRAKDNWFWENATESQKGNFSSVIAYLDNSIGHNLKIDGKIGTGLQGHRSRLYKL